MAALSRRFSRLLLAGATVGSGGGPLRAQEAGVEPPRVIPRLADGYRGIWYSNQPTGDEYVFKYSGGFATYPQQHRPIAVYDAAARRTVFVYGARGDDGSLLHAISFYDHRTGRLPRPRVLLDKKTRDAHDNPTLCIDRGGRAWVFSNSHGTARPSCVHVACEPHAIDAFARVHEGNFSYGQPWALPDGGVVLLHTRYEEGCRRLWTQEFDEDGRAREARPLARMERGHYQVSTARGARLATAFNVHPERGGLNARTDLYYLQSEDGGRSWTDVRGQPVPTPMERRGEPGRVRDTGGRLVYLKDVALDRDGHPWILTLQSGGWRPGPASEPRVWVLERWTGEGWVREEVLRSDHNYDFGELAFTAAGPEVLAAALRGAHPWATGGDIGRWRRPARQATGEWVLVEALTSDPHRQPTFPRRPLDAHPDLVAFWADANPLEESASRLYYADQGGRVFRMPATMLGDQEAGERVR